MAPWFDDLPWKMVISIIFVKLPEGQFSYGPDKTCQEWHGQGYRHCKLAKQEDEIPSGYLT